MANQKSKYRITLYVRVEPRAKEYADKQIPERFQTLSAYINYLIRKDQRRGKLKTNDRQSPEL